MWLGGRRSGQGSSCRPLPPAGSARRAAPAIRDADFCPPPPYLSPMRRSPAQCLGVDAATFAQMPVRSLYCYILLKFLRPVHYMFVDESGTAQIRRAAARTDAFYIRCGLIVHMDDVHRARAAVDRAKRELFRGKDTMKWELHGYEIWRSKGRFAADMRIPDSRKPAVFIRTVEAINESGAVLVTVIIRKNRLASKRNSLLKLSWRLIAERFEQYLADCGGGERGNIVADASERGTEAKIRPVAGHVCRHGPAQRPPGTRLEGCALCRFA